MRVAFSLDGKKVEWEAEPWEVLLDAFQREGHYTTIRRCSTGDCLTCTCGVDGSDVQSCQVFVRQMEGAVIETAGRQGGTPR